MSGWQRVSRRDPCPVCTKPDWCTLAVDGSAVCCMRIESDKPLRNGGWLHRLVEAAPTRLRRPHVRTVQLTARNAPAGTLSVLAARYRGSVNPRHLQRLAQTLGLSVESLDRLGIGWDGASWTFPMVDAGNAVVGIRRRFPDGRKLSVKGGREGLFVPDGLPDTGSLFTCEGPTDTAALLTLGFPAIGRPSCRGGVRLLCEFCKGRAVVVLGDADEPGRIGAWTLGQALRLYSLSVRVIRPPENAKDAREWLRLGATVANVQRAVSAAEPLRLEVQTKPAPFVAEPVTRRHCHVR